MVIPIPAEVLAPPVAFEELKHKPGRRTTWRATAGDGHSTAIVKRYTSGRAPLVAARLAVLHPGPRSPCVPQMLHLDTERGAVVLSDVPGRPLREAVFAGDTDAFRMAGQAMGTWHAWWRGRSPAPLRPHGADREVALLLARAAGAPAEIAEAVNRMAPSLAFPWPCSTVVHRDLYEEQVLVDALGEIGLIDLDDAALGPPELDLGNFIAHLELLGLRRGSTPGHSVVAFLVGHADAAGPLDAALLERCRRLTLLRLACIHREPALLEIPTS